MTDNINVLVYFKINFRFRNISFIKVFSILKLALLLLALVLIALLTLSLVLLVMLVLNCHYYYFNDQFVSSYY